MLWHEKIMQELMDKTEQTLSLQDITKRNILLLHCEISSERGPKL